jgi:superfamily II DNA or RNA helicase
VANCYDLAGNQHKLEAVYQEMEYELAQLEKRSENYSQHIFAVLMKARRHAELCKVSLFAEMAKDLYDEGKSVCLFVNFDDTVDGIYKRILKLGLPEEEIGFIVGGQHANVRQADIEGFNADTKRILIINIAAGGTGISLHDLNGKFPRATIISPNWSAQNLRQALGRVWRQGGLTKSYQVIVYGAKTVEEQICRRVQAKLNCLDTLNDGDLAEHLDLM